jgi:transposase-like protein
MSKRTAEEPSGQLKLAGAGDEAVAWIREDLRTRMRASVLNVVAELFEEEMTELCGAPWSRKEPGRLRSGGTERGSIYLDGRRVAVKYPRTAGTEGSQALPSYKALRSQDLLGGDVQAKLLRGVSTRDFEDVVSAIAGGTGLRRTAVSRAFTRASKKSLEELNSRDLSKQSFAVLFLDGVGFGADTTLVVGMGITSNGEKVILGLREGHTENADLVGEFLDSLVARGLVLEERFLVVLDGGKALRQAVLARWKGRALLQRCQAHKKRNVIDKLPPQYHSELKRRMNAAYGLKSFEDAKKMLEGAVHWLEQISEPAARSLEEGLEETLTVVKLELPDLLRRTLATTNPIESIFDGVRYRTGRVKRWRRGRGQMAARWAAGALCVVEKRLHKIKGHRLMPMLLNALKQATMDEKKQKQVG